MFQFVCNGFNPCVSYFLILIYFHISVNYNNAHFKIPKLSGGATIQAFRLQNVKTLEFVKTFNSTLEHKFRYETCQ